jgi:cytochrome P450
MRGQSAFAPRVWQAHPLGRRHFVLNNPDGIKHALVDHAENYWKPSILRRTFEPGFGKGLLTSEGEIWRRHRLFAMTLMITVFVPHYDRAMALIAQPTGATTVLGVARYVAGPDNRRAEFALPRAATGRATGSAIL